MKKVYYWSGALVLVICGLIALLVSWYHRGNEINRLASKIDGTTKYVASVDTIKAERDSLKAFVDSVKHIEFLRENNLLDADVHDTIEVYIPRDKRLDDIEETLQDIQAEITDMNYKIDDLDLSL